MTTYEGLYRFGSDTVPEDKRQEWVEAIRSSLPEGTTFDLRVVPFALPVEDVTEQHAGNQVRVWTGKDHGEVTGVLDHVFITGFTSNNLGRTLVIDNKAYAVPVFATVEMGDW